MGLDISVISNIKPMDLPEGIKKWSDEYYDWEEKEDGYNALRTRRG